jgi:HK97 family phage major capsid protein
VMNRKTQSTVRKFKDSTGNYLWQPPVAVNGKSSLIGFPLADTEDMPDVAANSLSIAFGDFRRGYLIVDRAGIRVIRDPFRQNPTSCSTRPNVSAAACRISTRSSC